LYVPLHYHITEMAFLHSGKRINTHTMNVPRYILYTDVLYLHMYLLRKVHTYLYMEGQIKHLFGWAPSWNWYHIASINYIFIGTDSLLKRVQLFIITFWRVIGKPSNSYASTDAIGRNNFPSIILNGTWYICGVKIVQLCLTFLDDCAVIRNVQICQLWKNSPKKTNPPIRQNSKFWQKNNWSQIKIVFKSWL
jgi:hypothetical protein